MAELIAQSTALETFVTSEECVSVALSAVDTTDDTTLDLGDLTNPSLDGITWVITYQSADILDTLIGHSLRLSYVQTTAGGQVLTSVQYVTVVEGVLGAREQLCTVAQVRERGNFSSADSADDRRIQALINALPRIIRARYGREFIGTATPTTRHFEARSAHVDLAGSDLRSVTSVTIGNPAVTLASAQYVAMPYGGDDMTGTFSAIKLAPSVPSSAFSSDFGFEPMAVTGTWGVWTDVSDVPADIIEAACEVVLANLDKPSATIAGIDSGDARGSMTPQSWDIPFSAHRKFLPYSRELGVY